MKKNSLILTKKNINWHKKTKLNKIEPKAEGWYDNFWLG